MIRHEVKTVRVQSRHFAKGVLINADAFDQDAHRLLETKKTEDKPSTSRQEVK